mgnify:CR=1 FL=1
MFQNDECSEAMTKFMEGLGEVVDLKGHLQRERRGKKFELFF